MLSNYAPILVLVVLVAGFALVNLLMTDVLGKKRKSIAKGSAYECGMGAQGSARLRLSVHFYIVAVLFILFDVESIFLIPWAASVRELTELGVGKIVFLEISFFVLVLVVGLVYEWRRGGLRWDR